MSSNQYNSVLRNGLTRRLWLVITLAMLIPVGLALFSRWFEAEERRASLQNQELTALSREKASTLLFNSREIPSDFARGLEGASSSCSTVPAPRASAAVPSPRN